MNQKPKLSGVHIVSKDEYRKVEECAWDAFTDYPLFEYISGKGHGGMVAGIGYGIEAKCKKNDWIVISDSADFNGVAFFVPPDAKPTSNMKYILNGALRILAKNGLGVIKRMDETGKFADDVRKRVGGEDAWYLYGLMVRHKSHGKGVGSSLMKPALKYLDSIDAKCYLETYKPKNVPIYEHLGFELKDTVTVPGTDLTLYSMLKPSVSERETKSPSESA